MPVFSKISGTWRTVSQTSSKINGVWRNSQPSVKISGVWRGAPTELTADQVTYIDFVVIYADRDPGNSNQRITMTADSIETYVTRPSSSSYGHHARVEAVMRLLTIDGKKYVMADPQGYSGYYADGVYYPNLDAYGLLLAYDTRINVQSFIYASNYGAWPSGINGILGSGQYTYWVLEEGQYDYRLLRYLHGNAISSLYSSDPWSSSTARYTVEYITNLNTGGHIPFGFISIVTW